MKILIYGFAMSLGLLASGAQAELTLSVDGEDLPVSALMENCRSMSAQAEAQIACFDALSQLLDEQAGIAPVETTSVPQALDDLRAVAQYTNGETGLSIVGTDCNIQVVYFNNYFHISRRNISTIDVFSAQFDASQLLQDQTTQAQGGQNFLSKAVLDGDATATVHGGMALESTTHNFDAKSPRATLDVYATEVIGQLPASENQAFDFVLVHPNRSQASNEIWTAFDAFVSACKG